LLLKTAQNYIKIKRFPNAKKIFQIKDREYQKKVVSLQPIILTELSGASVMSE
jgi:hypothetical protein